MNNNLSFVRELFSCARDRILIVSAYVSEAAIETLLDGSEAVDNRVVYARWEVRDIQSGASEWQAWDALQDRNVPFYACPGLHAKAYVADDRALIGSANATSAGLGLARNPNLELLVEIDANHSSIETLLDVVRKTAYEAPPFGPDAGSSHSEENSERGTHNSSIWIPKSEPLQFLDAMTGIIEHDSLSIEDSEHLNLAHLQHSSRDAIRDAVRNMTAFRIVSHEFQSRVKPMALSELRTLLSNNVSNDLANLSNKEISRLARWMGEFGTNTYASPTTQYSELLLMPGMLLGSDEEIKNNLAKS